MPGFRPGRTPSPLPFDRLTAQRAVIAGRIHVTLVGFVRERPVYTTTLTSKE